MGLDTTHGAWHGAYSAFMRWRQKLAEVAGLPPLGLMEGFFEKGGYHDPFSDLAKQYPEMVNNYYSCLPIRWSCLKRDILHRLLYHSDCDGRIGARHCGPLAVRLEKLLPLLSDKEVGGHIGNFKDKTQEFIDGLWKASRAHEPLEFH